MLKVYSNGVHVRTHFSLHLKRLFLYSRSTTTKGSPSSMVDLMAKSLDLSREEAVSLWNKVSASNLKLSKGNSELVLDFLKQRGFNNTQIRKLISSKPELLRSKVDKTLVPKLNALQELGVSGSDLAHIVTYNPSILKMGLTTRINPMVNFVKSILGTNENFLRLLKRSYWLMSTDMSKKLQPNRELFRKYGLSDERTLKLLIRNGEIFVHDPKRIEEFIIRVIKEFEIPPESASFPEAVVLLASYSNQNLETKYEIFKSFGWTDLDVRTMLRKSPKCLMLSETTIRERLDFFMNVMECKPGYLADRPYVMTYSVKDRVLPRYTILQVLKERKCISAEVTVLTVVCISESVFVKKYVLPYKDELPDICEAYIASRDKGNPVS